MSRSDSHSKTSRFLVGPRSHIFVGHFVASLPLVHLLGYGNFTVLAAELLRSYIKWDIQQIGFKCGFSSSAHFSRAFKRVYGVTPGVYRKLCVRERAHFRNATEAQNSDHFRIQMIRAAFEKVHAW